MLQGHFPVRKKWLFEKHLPVHDICSIAQIWSWEILGLSVAESTFSLLTTYVSLFLYLKISKETSFFFQYSNGKSKPFPLFLLQWSLLPKYPLDFNLSSKSLQTPCSLSSQSAEICFIYCIETCLIFQPVAQALKNTLEINIVRERGEMPFQGVSEWNHAELLLTYAGLGL